MRPDPTDVAFLVTADFIAALAQYVRDGMSNSEVHAAALMTAIGSAAAVHDLPAPSKEDAIAIIHELDAWLSLRLAPTSRGH